MEIMLVSVTIVSLGLATTMSLVAWKLLRDERLRKAARIDALEAMAFDSAPAAPSVAPVVGAVAHRPPAHPPASPVARVPDEAPALPDAPLWDLSLREEPTVPAGSFMDRERDAAFPNEDAAGRLFAAAPETGTFNRRWLALAAVGLIVAAAVATLSALRSPEIQAAVRVTKEEAPKPVVGPHPLELLSLSHATNPGAGFTVSGLVQNPLDGQALDHVVAIVYLFDAQGRYFATGSAGLEPAAFKAGEESPFTVLIPNASGVSRYRIGFRGADGTIVGHVDHRVQFAERTTGEMIESPEPAPVAAAAPLAAMHSAERPKSAPSARARLR